MTVLARILLRTSNTDLTDIAERLFFSASALNEPMATLQIVSGSVQKRDPCQTSAGKPAATPFDACESRQ
jgi:hypothetical protein